MDQRMDRKALEHINIFGGDTYTPALFGTGFNVNIIFSSTRKEKNNQVKRVCDFLLQRDEVEL